jgi:hypothetical protein
MHVYMFACMDGSLNSVCTASLGNTYAAYYILGRKHTLMLRFQTRTVSNTSLLKYSYSFQLANC